MLNIVPKMGLSLVYQHLIDLRVVQNDPYASEVLVLLGRPTYAIGCWHLAS